MKGVVIQMFTVQNRRIAEKSGVYGCNHDPYTYDEYTFIENDREVCKLHLGGLGAWLEYEGCRQMYDDSEVAISAFNEIIGRGFSFNKYMSRKMKAEWLRRSQCSVCGSKRLQWHSGYPGESLLVCEDCGKCCDYSFNERAIM